jgi:tRNA threonylcarbamoyladenosine biosynthesis protein TsaE
MELLGEAIGKTARPGDIILLEGSLGSGKTTLTKGIAKGLDVQDEITSPTFNLIKQYGGSLDLYHFDLYRLEEEKELLHLGYEEYFYGNGVTVIEWADYLDHYLPEEYLLVRITYGKGEEVGREVDISGHGARYKEFVEELKYYDYSGD